MSDELTARWAERDRRREEAEWRTEEARRAHRDRHVAIVERALAARLSGFGQRQVAEVAVDALLDAGVVFAYMGNCDDSADSTEEEEQQ
jgi:hypothetical protein